jgi:hypothetical protein
VATRDGYIIQVNGAIWVPADRDEVVIKRKTLSGLIT